MIILTIHGLVEILCLILRLLIRYAYNILKLEKSILRQWPGYFQVKHIANTFWTYLQFMVFIFLVWSGCMLCNPSSRHLFTAFLLGSIFWSSSLLRTICLPTSCCLHFVLISIYNLVFSYKNNLWSSNLCVWFFHLTFWSQGAFIFLQMTQICLPWCQSRFPLCVNTSFSLSSHLLMVI